MIRLLLYRLNVILNYILLLYYTYRASQGITEYSIDIIEKERNKDRRYYVKNELY